MAGRSVVLFSAGLDSTVNLYAARAAGQVERAITFDYGQRAAQRERERAVRMTEQLGITHIIIELPWLKALTRTSLVNREAIVPTRHEVQIADQGISQQTADRVWVPNRNGVFLNIAAAVAEAVGADEVVPGFNLEEAATFPDNSIDFLKATDQAFRFSTRGRVRTHCYTGHLNKSGIYRLGLQLGVPMQEVWPCYLEGPEPCGQCESCLRFLNARQQVVGQAVNEGGGR